MRRGRARAWAPQGRKFLAGACWRESTPMGVRMRGHRRRMQQGRNFWPAHGGEKMRGGHRRRVQQAKISAGVKLAENCDVGRASARAPPAVARAVVFGRRLPAEKKRRWASGCGSTAGGCNKGRNLAGVSWRKNAMLGVRVRGHRMRSRLWHGTAGPLDSKTRNEKRNLFFSFFKTAHV